MLGSATGAASREPAGADGASLAVHDPDAYPCPVVSSKWDWDQTNWNWGSAASIG